MVVSILKVLLILEDGVEIVHAVTRQEPYISDHASHTSCSERSSRESDEDDFVTWRVVGSYEGVHFSNVLQ